MQNHWRLNYVAPVRKLSTLAPFSLSEKVIYWSTLLTPLWWLLGIQPLLYPTIVMGVIIATLMNSPERSTPDRTPIPISVWAWLAMSIAMLWTALIGLSGLEFPIMKVAAAFVTLYKSYLLIFGCLLLPFVCKLRSEVITRAIAWLSIGYLGALAVQLLILLSGSGFTGFIPPLSQLIPADKQSLRVEFATFQPFFGIPLPRTALYLPDPPILGVCGLLFFFVCLGEKNVWLKRLSLVGCFVALVISQSRSAWIAFAIALIVLACLRSGKMRQGSLGFGSLGALLATVMGVSVSELIEKPMEVFTSARAESSGDRELVVRKTIEAWQEQPWLGWGVIQGSVKWYIYDIALGSFSTYSSVLYLHGVFGFAVFLVALVTTVWDVWKPALQGNAASQQAVACLISLYFVCNATPLSWMSVYLWVFFLWLGTVFVEQHVTYIARSHSLEWQ